MHWHQVVASACEQCSRNRIPSIHPVESFDRWLGSLPRATDELRLTLSPVASRRLRDCPAPRAVLLLAGPEGGLTSDEIELAGQFGFQGLRLGPRILRTETAALAAISAMHALWGDF
jgi:16S rRNA (uracil1498-N3)-methyltransferase